MEHMDIMGLGNNIGLGTHLEGGDFICKTPDCFVCKRAGVQSTSDNASWKKHVEEVLKGLDENIGIGSNPVTVETLQQLGSSNLLPEKKTSYYFYDKRFGRKRRYDPWFSQHAAQLEAQTDEAQPPAPKIQKRNSKRSKSKSPTESPCIESDGDQILFSDLGMSGSNSIPEADSSHSPEIENFRKDMTDQLRRVRDEILNIQGYHTDEEKETMDKLFENLRTTPSLLNELLTEVNNSQLNLLGHVSPNFML